MFVDPIEEIKKGFDNKHIIITGHYGTGKTNIAIELAQCFINTEPTCLIDCDIVNPYFRSSDNKEELENMGITVISPNFANTNLDTPSLPATIMSAFYKKERVVWDVGGDDAGAIVLGMYEKRFVQQGYSLLYVINCCRPLTETPEDMYQYMKEIETASRLKACAIINNTNLSYLTDVSIIENGLKIASCLSDISGIPILFTTLMDEKNAFDDSKYVLIKNHTIKI